MNYIKSLAIAIATIFMIAGGNLNANTLIFSIDYQQQAASKRESAEKPVKKPADGRTKTGDKIDKTMKGPNGETVYTGPKGGKYYLGKGENKIYLKKE